mgnify:CR=1 FL=1
MHDAYGDGWNGGSATLTADADGCEAMSMAVEGSTASASFTLDGDDGGGGDCSSQRLSVGGGSWDSDISFTF